MIWSDVLSRVQWFLGWTSENQKLQQFFLNFLLIVSRVFSFIFDQPVFVFHDLGEAHKPCMHFSRSFLERLDRIISWEFNLISFEFEIYLHFWLLPLVPSNCFCWLEDLRYSSMPDSCYLARKKVRLFLIFAGTFKSTCSRITKKQNRRCFLWNVLRLVKGHQLFQFSCLFRSAVEIYTLGFLEFVGKQPGLKIIL